jgi:Dolichyl-phosphate-mannose-protein mannosyltransferase
VIEGCGRAQTFLAGSLASALVGQSLLTGFPLAMSVRESGAGVLPGASFLVLSILLAATAAGRTAVEPEADERRMAPSLWRRAGVAAGLAAAALYAIAGESLAVRVLWPAGAVLFVLSFRAERGRVGAAWPRGAALADSAILLALAGAGFVLRYVRLPDWPSELDADFASAGLQVTALQGDPRCVGVGDSNLPLVFYQGLKLSAALFGLDMHGLMTSSALLGTLCIGAVYLLGVEAGGRRVGLVAAALLATGYTAIHFSRVILTPSALLGVTLMTFFLLRALRRREPLWFALAGVAGGASCLAYFGGRVAPLIAGALFLHDVATARSAWRLRLRGWITMAGAALLTVGPMLVFYARRPAALVARGADVTIFTPRNRAHLMGSYHVETMGQMLVEQVKRTFLTFHLFGDSSSEFGFRGPMVDAFTAAFLLVGLGLTLRRARSRFMPALVAWITGVLVVGGVLTLDPPDWVHLVAALPAVTVLAALGVDACIRSLAGDGLPRRAGPTVVAAVLLAAFAVHGWNVYVRAVRDNAGAFCSVARFVDGLPSDTRVLIVRDPLSWADRTFRFFDRGVDGRDVSRDEARDLARADKPVVLVMTPAHAEALLSPLRSRFPESPTFAHYSHGWLHFYSLHVAPVKTRAAAAAAPYRSLGRTSPLGWCCGLFVALLAAAAPWLVRGSDA